MRRCDRNKKHESPWEKDPKLYSNIPDDRKHFLEDVFSSYCFDNKYLDISTKRAAIKASTSVVSLIVYSGNDEIFQGTGTIIEEDGTILTSTELVKVPACNNVLAKNLKIIVYMWDGKSYKAKLCAHDFYYRIAVIKIEKNVPQLKPACLRPVDDYISVGPSALQIDNYKKFKLRPGDRVIAIGRYFTKPYELMAAPGEFSIQRCDESYECKELFSTTCIITETGYGGPFINCHGEVIGVSVGDSGHTPFLPINIALVWWTYLKKHGKLRQRPLLGMQLANLYTTDLILMEMINLKFPNSVAGVVVEDVKQGSSADTAGVCPGDLIIQCSGKPVRSLLEFVEMMWNKSEDDVELVVLRAIGDDPLQLTLKVVEAK